MKTCFCTHFSLSDAVQVNSARVGRAIEGATTILRKTTDRRAGMEGEVPSILPLQANVHLRDLLAGHNFGKLLVRVGD